MGQEKEKIMQDEENAKKAAKARGDVCYIGGEPLLTAKEKADGCCSRHTALLEKED